MQLYIDKIAGIHFYKFKQPLVISNGYLLYIYCYTNICAYIRQNVVLSDT